MFRGCGYSFGSRISYVFLLSGVWFLCHHARTPVKVPSRMHQPIFYKRKRKLDFAGSSGALCRIKVPFTSLWAVTQRCSPHAGSSIKAPEPYPEGSIFQVTALGHQLLKFFKVSQPVLAPNMSPGSVPLGHPWEGRWLGTIHPTAASKSVHKGSHCPAVPMAPRHPYKFGICTESKQLSVT